MHFFYRNTAVVKIEIPDSETEESDFGCEESMPAVDDEDDEDDDDDGGNSIQVEYTHFKPIRPVPLTHENG